MRPSDATNIVVVAGERQLPAVSQLLAIAMPLKSKPLPPAADLWERYSYNPLTGELFSLKRPWRPALGSVTKLGYRELTVYWHGPKTTWQAARVIWKWVTGEDPKETIDHIDRNPGNNRFWNLRDADWSTQMKNRDYTSPGLVALMYGYGRNPYQT